MKLLGLLVGRDNHEKEKDEDYDYEEDWEQD
jgi:hypothetical protein